MTARTVVCVGAVVRREDRLLAIRQAQGHALEGQWTIPWGRLDAGESPAAAAVRETSEEAGIVAAVEGLVGAQELPEHGWIALVYLCRHVAGTPEPDHRETDAARYLSLQELEALPDPIEAWSEWLMRRALKEELRVTLESPSNPYRPKSGFI